ncbi:MAG: TrkH family potassium uptake protein [Stackebrandtia sp.]
MRQSLRRQPARLVPAAFLGVITVGTLLLLLPISREGDAAAPFLTALFTATSAVCVTGLIVVDTPSYWSGFGEGVIAVLIQAGGFGIMTFASLLGLLVAGRLGLRGKMLAQAETKALDLGDVRGVVMRVGIITLSVEFVVAVVLAARFKFEYGYAFGEALWLGVFHSISAFNNAGFALYPDSLMSFAKDPVIMLPISLAIVIGGIGFPVLVELGRKIGNPAKWSIHTKITLVGTGLLLWAGFLGYLAFEWDNPDTMGPMSLGQKVHAALFATVTARTAGFNGVDVGALNNQTWLMTDVLMFIGGGSAGTAGGIKVTTFFLLAFVIWAEIRGEPDVPVFKRTVVGSAQRQALTVALLGVGLVVAGTMTISTVTEHPLDQVLFEVTSAFATVGLSTGITAQLPALGEVVLIALMFTGRVGTITVASSMALRHRRRAYRFPDERPIVG